MELLKGQTAIVTGASRGIGRAIALELAREGAAVLVNYLTGRAEAEAAVAEIVGAGGRAAAFRADVSSEADVRALVARGVEHFGPPDILVCSAGVTRDRLLGAMKMDDWDAVIRTNTGGVFLTIREALPHMMARRRGSIVAISSIAAEKGGRGHANYVASKGAINAMIRSLAIELAPRGIRVNAVAPGLIVTPMTSRIRAFADAELKAEIPLKRYGEPQEVARAVRFLASADASYITGEILHVAGGLGV